MDPQDSTPDQSPERTTATASNADGDETTTADGGPGSDRDEERGVDAEGGRDVVVPMRVYKAVTVFTTLFAVATVVGGFVLLDSATDRATASLSEIDPLVALAGIGLIVAGAAAYAFSTRFRAAEMGKPKDDTDEPPDNG